MISIRNLTKSFNNHPVLDGLNLDIGTGESVAIIGRSGNGKSVLLKCILGLITPDSGEIIFTDEKTGAQSDKLDLDMFGMLFQNSALFDSLRVWENVAFRMLHEKGYKHRGALRARAIEKLEKTGLDAQTADAYPVELSGGMQKRAALARAIMSDPHLIFFDEPTSGLDPIIANVINRLIREITTELGATTVTITHALSSITTIADNVAMLEGGKISYKGSVKDIERANDPALRQFLQGSEKGPIKIRS